MKTAFFAETMARMVRGGRAASRYAHIDRAEILWDGRLYLSMNCYQLAGFVLRSAGARFPNMWAEGREDDGAIHHDDLSAWLGASRFWMPVAAADIRAGDLINWNGRDHPRRWGHCGIALCPAEPAAGHWTDGILRTRLLHSSAKNGGAAESDLYIRANRERILAVAYREDGPWLRRKAGAWRAIEPLSIAGR